MSGLTLTVGAWYVIPRHLAMVDADGTFRLIDTLGLWGDADEQRGATVNNGHWDAHPMNQSPSTEPSHFKTQSVQRPTHTMDGCVQLTRYRRYGMVH